MVVTGPTQLPVAELDSIKLSDLEDMAALQTRKDRKYLVPLPQVARILEQVGLQVLEIDGLRTFRYESVYFDTPDRVSYLAAAHRRRRRFKVRTRSYLDSGICLLEVKTREGRGLTVKHRIPYDIDGRRSLDGGALGFVDGFDAIAPLSSNLRPALTTRYRRTTLFDPFSQSRITVDTDLEFVAADGTSVTLPDVAIVETKTDGRPCSVDRLLWEAHHRPTKISKYGTGLAALTPALPANKWNRILRRYFGWTPQPGDGVARRHPPASQQVPSPGRSPVADRSASAGRPHRRPALEGARS